jgi:hypothetical protein
MTSRLGYLVPSFNVRYDESNTGKSWFISSGGTRCYLTRGEAGHTIDFSEQAADSHFLMIRIVAALLLSGAGLYDFELKGRLVFYGVNPIHWESAIEAEPFWPEEIKRVHSAFSTERFSGWLKAIMTHRFIYRAAEDAVLALRAPTESFVFIYRGFEWIEDGLKISKQELAQGVGVPLKNLKHLGEIANVESGVRHATKTGVKMRADVDNYSTWIAGLLDAINFARKKVESSFVPMTAEEVAEALSVAVKIQPYPY